MMYIFAYMFYLVFNVLLYSVKNAQSIKIIIILYSSTEDRIERYYTTLLCVPYTLCPEKKTKMFFVISSIKLW